MQDLLAAGFGGFSSTYLFYFSVKMRLIRCRAGFNLQRASA